jgi:hypothetical protein
MIVRSLIFALILGSSAAVSSDAMPGPTAKRSATSTKAVQSLPMAIGLEDSQGNVSGVALIAQ